jgi:chromosome segregation protein
MGGVRLVTLGGEITEPGGAMIGGSKQKMKAGFGGKIHGASEVDKLVGEVERLSIMAQTVAAALREARTRQHEIRTKINSLAEDDHSVKAGTIKAEMELAEKVLVKARGVAIQLNTRLSELDSDHTGKLAMVESASMKFLEAEAARDLASEDLSNSSPDGIRKRLLEAQSLRLEAEGASNKAQLTLDSGKEMSELLTQTLDSLTSRADEIQAGMAGREKSVKEWKLYVEKETILLNQKEEERASLLDEHQELENERKELVEERAEVKAAANQKANSAINSRSMAEDISRNLAIREQKLADLLVEMAAESVPVAEDGAELPNVGDAQKRVNDLRRKLDRYGDFNMLAIEQYDSCKKRLDEMKDDFKVLQERRKRLLDITDKLESQRKTRLLSTLKEVNENFKVVYNRLSNGGRGELFLENPDEPFKGGLDMWAQPRGKSNKSRLQGLSGGEKSMASLSLIFAIQDHDPSPFYYFDEVDQNLDVPNSKLIATECRNRSEAAQFIMVTLRKVSLELADHHIGITHGGDGCSRRIVDFDRDRAIELGAQAEKEATDAADKNHSRIEEARIIAHEMPEVPDALPAPKSLGGLLNHIEEEGSENGFESLTERAEELTEEIEERQKIVSELLADEVEEKGAEKEV